MRQHSKSLLLSIVIHAILFIVFFYTYDEVVSFLGEHKEKKVCIKLGCIHSVASQRVVAKKVETKVHKDKKVFHKKVHKKIPNTKKKIKKESLKKVTSPKKIVRAKKVPKIKKQQETPHADMATVEKEAATKETKTTLETILPKEAQEKSCEKESSQAEFVKRYIVEIAQLLQENLYYPLRARKRGIEGEVVVRFTLTKEAKVKGSKVVSSSDKLLSRAALKTLENLSGKFPKPDEDLTLTVPISYMLNN